MSKWAQNPARDEKEIFYEYARKIGIKNKKNLKIFRKIATLSPTAVLLGHDTLYCGVNKGVGYLRIPNVGWARSHFIGGIKELKPTFDQIIEQGNIENVLTEKANAVNIWRRIETLSRQLEVPDKSLKEFIVTSCTYGRINYEIFEKGWTIMLLGYFGDRTGKYAVRRIADALVAYDRLWDQWRQLRKNSPSCATISRDTYIGWSPVHSENLPGIKDSVNKYRKVLADLKTK
jgi:hypothetical protein